ncbi:MAG: F0F1 ATP synthase subunit epsilon [Anaplasma sp.]
MEAVVECFKVVLISPDRRLDFSNVCSLSARTSAGAFMVMAHHERSVMDLVQGEVVLRGDGGRVIDVVLMSNAVMSVGDNECTIVADFVLTSEERDSERLKSIGDSILEAATSEGLFGELAKKDLAFIDKVLKG